MTTPTNTRSQGGAETLLPCPFCGDSGPQEAESAVPNVRGGKKRAVYCNACFSEGPTADTVEEAISLWNSRGNRPVCPKTPDGRQTCNNLRGPCLGGCRLALAAPASAQEAEVQRLGDLVQQLRNLAWTCYAGLGGECNLPEPWLDALNAAAYGEPFSTEGLLPFVYQPSAAVQQGEALDDPEPTYTTQPGESLMGIAFRELSSEHRWKEIRNMNAAQFGMLAPHEYYPVGSVLRMPADYHKGRAALASAQPKTGEPGR